MFDELSIYSAKQIHRKEFGTIPELYRVLLGITRTLNIPLSCLPLAIKTHNNCRLFIFTFAMSGQYKTATSIILYTIGL